MCVPQGGDNGKGRLYKGDGTQTPSGCGGTSAQAVGPTSRVLSRPVVGTSGVFRKNSATLDQHDRVWPRLGPVLVPKGTLAQWVEQRLGLAVGHRFESDRFHATSSRALHKSPVRSRRRAFFVTKTMITRQDVQRVLEALDERVLMELLVNPVDALCDTWDYRYYNSFRRLARAGDWSGLTRKPPWSRPRCP